MTNQHLVAATLSIAVASALHAQTHVFVDDDAPDGGDGLSWNSAFNDLHDAIGLAVSLGQNRGEIRIGEGFYPSEGNPFEIPLAAPGQTPMRVFGGYAGYSFPSQPDLRDVDDYQTILSSEGVSNTIVLTSAVTLGPAGGGRPVFIGALSATTLDGLTVRGGEATAVYNTDRFLSFRMNNCSVIGVRPGSGGAVKLTDLDVEIARSFFALNEPFRYYDGGGAISISGGSVAITSSDFLGNTLKDTGGGAIRMMGGDHRIVDCSFYSNTSQVNGGGAIYADVQTISIRDSEFIGNETTQYPGDGGAVWLRVDIAVSGNNIDGCLFTDNKSAGYGGAITAWYLGGGLPDFVISNSDFHYNMSNQNGGAVSRKGAQDNSVLVDECNFVGNSAESGGAVDGSIYVERSSFIRNSAIIFGGAVYGRTHNDINECEFFDNTADREGGGVYAVSAITLSNFDGNSAGIRGGAVSNAWKFVSVVASNNSAPIGAGGYDIREIHESDIHHNDGGGVAGGGIRVEDSIISDNINGTGLAFDEANSSRQVIVLGSAIERNQGAGIIFGDPIFKAELVMSDTVVADNAGYGLELSHINPNASFDVFLERCTIAGNSDGAIKIQSQPSNDRDEITLVDSLLHAHNGTAVDTTLDTDIILAGCTIIGTGTEVGAPIVIGLNSTLIAESTVIEALESQYTIDLTNSDALLIQCMLSGGIDSIAALSEDNIEVIGKLYDESPGFITRTGIDNDPATWRDNDYRLASGSSAIDRGSNLLFAINRDTDLDGQDRRVDDSGMPDDGIGFAPFADIGAYEFQGTTCPGDLNNNGVTDPGDFSHWIAAFNTMSRRADQNFDGAISPPDFIAWLANYNAGCK